ncbi:MAG: hypothetical protein CBB97_16595 [Candidatus Endolissoclinum sp. TMED37]|nr:MAG: hypothetical protein CBB97_16595 [Candidatus Endolissoclinum sp. TMED37]
MKKIKFYDPKVNSKSELRVYLREYKKFLLNGQFIMGNEVEKFEKKISIYIKKKFTIGVSSGTNALYLALKSLGVKRGDHVLVPCLSWVSTFTAVTQIGAIPVGVDINQNQSLDEKKISERITKKTKALIYVNFSGFVDNLDIIKKICKNRKIFLIEDGAQSFGGLYMKKPVGYYGDISCFSMNPVKVFSGIGDAGTISTNSKKIYDKLKIFRYAGTVNKQKVIDPELNHKIDTLHAIILNRKLSSVKDYIKERIKIAKKYDFFLNSKNIIKPKIFNNFQHIYYTYTLMAKSRDKLQKYLNKRNVETKIHHPYLVCDHPGLKNKFNKIENFPIGKKIIKNIISLPIHKKIEKKDIIKINYLIKKFYNEK